MSNSRHLEAASWHMLQILNADGVKPPREISRELVLGDRSDT